MGMEESGASDFKMKIFEDHPLLKDDEYAVEVITKGVTKTGRKVEGEEAVRRFAEIRESFLQSEQMKKDLKRLRDGSPDIYDVAVVSSERPDMEIKEEM